jgi:thiol-disulfide isomerase/thioredoxin
LDPALIAIRVLLAGVFAVAAVGKLADLEGSRAAARGFGLGRRAAAVTGTLLPVAELAIAIALIPAESAAAAAAAAAVLLLAFSVSIALNMAAGRQPECHCFGQLHSAPAGPGTLARNLGLAALAAFAAIAGRADAGPSLLGWVGGLDTGTAVLLGLLLAVAAAAALALLALLRQQGRLLLRLDAIEAALDRAGVKLPEALDPAEQALFVTGLPEGSPAPAFELPTPGGLSRSLTDLLQPGVPLALLFVDPSCGPCRALLAEVSGRDGGSEVAVAVISSGDEEANAALAEEYEVPDLLVQDKDEVSRAYEITATPSAVLVSSDGEIAGMVAQGPAAIAQLLAGGRATGPRDDLAVHRVNGAEPSLPLRSRPPSLLLDDLSGNEVDLAELAGADRVVVFWNPSCGFCQAMLPEMRRWEDDPPPGAPELLFISAGSREEAAAMGLRSRVLLDPGFAAGNVFGATGTPMAVRLDAEGRVASAIAAGSEAVLALAGPAPRRERLSG